MILYFIFIIFFSNHYLKPDDDSEYDIFLTITNNYNTVLNEKKRSRKFEHIVF